MCGHILIIGSKTSEALTPMEEMILPNLHHD
jgi:hypothetical protein